MSDVFVSYSRKDESKRDLLLTALKEADILYFCDFVGIPGGEEWRDAIDQAIDDSSVMVVIVTRAALESHYVTYEWARAMGNGIPVVPLLFDTESNVKAVKNPLLDRLQYIDCNNGIPDHVSDTLRSHWTLSPVDLQVRKLIFNTIMPFRLLLRVALFLPRHPLAEMIPLKVRCTLIKKAEEEGERVKENRLAELMVDKSHAFTTKLNRMCTTYIESLPPLLSRLGSLWRPLTPEREIDLDLVNRAEQYRVENLEKTILDINPYLSPFEYPRFDEYLKRLLQGEKIPDEIFVPFPEGYNYLRDHLLERFLSEDDANMIWEILENLRKKILSNE